MKAVSLSTLIVSLALFLAFTIQAKTSYILSFGLEANLTNPYVAAIANDCNDCIWIATESGLNRYDGSCITPFRHFYDQKGQKRNIFGLNAIFFNPEDSILWIGTRVDGVMTLDCRTMQFGIHFPEDTLGGVNNVTSICKAQDGGVWLAQNRDLPMRVAMEDGKVVVKGRIANLQNVNANTSIYEDRHGNIYLGLLRSGMLKINQASGETKQYLYNPSDKHSLPGSTVNVVFVDSHDNLWIGTDNGLGLYNPEDDSFHIFRHEEAVTTSLAGDNVHAIIETIFGCLWIGSDIGGISRVDMRSMTFFTPEDLKFNNVVTDHNQGSLYSNNVRALCQDRYGNVWVGNAGHGVDVINHLVTPVETLPYQYPNSDRNQAVWGMCFDQDSALWVGSENELAQFVNDELVNVYDLSPYIQRRGSHAKSIISTSEHTLLLGMSDYGLLAFDTRSGVAKQVPMSNYFENINTMYAEGDSVWIGADTGIFLYKNGQVARRRDYGKNLASMLVTGIVRDNQGKLWIGTYGGGVSIFDKTGQHLMDLRKMDGVVEDGTNCLLLQSDGSIWIGTRSGLWHVKDTSAPEVTKAYGANNGLEDLYIHSLVEDGNGHLWVSTSSSLFRKEGDDFLSFSFPRNSLIGNFVDRSALSGPNNSLYFASLNGIQRLNNNWEGFDFEVPQVRFTECRVLEDGREGRDYHVVNIDNKGNVRLHQEETSFQLFFSVPDCALTDLIEYAYMIKGKENKWISLGNQPYVYFRHMAPGTYNIIVRARMINQPWSSAKQASIYVTVVPVWYLTWWAKLIYALLFIGVVSWGIFAYRKRLRIENKLKLEKQRTQNMEELNDERMRFFTNITHELRTPLTLIIGPLEDMIADKHQTLPALRKLKMIHKNANQLLSLINQIMEFRKTQTQHKKLSVTFGSLVPLVTEIGLHFKELNNNDKVEINLQIDSSVPDLYYDADVVRTVISNLLSNAMKYTPEGCITLSLCQVEENNRLMVRMSVSDTGYGIEKDALPNIFDRYYQVDGKYQASGTGIGLSLVKALCELHQAEIKVDSELGKGTTFYFSVGLTNTYPEAIHKSLLDSESSATAASNFKSPDGICDENSPSQPLLLIVEDNPDIRKYVVDSFNDKYNIVTATNGEEGWTQTLTHMPDIIVSDIMMPVMDGNKLCRKIKDDIRTCHIPVILLTAKDQLHDKEEGFDNGADSYITKPFSAKLLSSAMRNLLEMRQNLSRWIANNPGLSLDGGSAVAATPSDDKPAMNAMDQKFVNSLNQIIHENIENVDLDISFLTQGLNMSQSTLYRKIKGLLGISANELIRKKRLQNAVRLMKDEGYNVSEAAYHSGFNHLDYFRTCFRREYGTTPTDYISKTKS